MKCFDFMLKAQYCDKTTHAFVGAVFCRPNEETLNWFREQGIRLWTSHQSSVGALCTAIDITDDQALLIQLAFDVHPDTQELYEQAEIRLTI